MADTSASASSAAVGSVHVPEGAVDTDKVSNASDDSAGDLDLDDQDEMQEECLL